MQQPHESLSRRSVLAMLGAVPVVAGTALATTGSGHADPGPSSASHVPGDLRPGGELDGFVAKLAARDEFSGVVRLTHRHRPVLERAYGMADEARSIRNEIDTIFCLASVNKLFTSVAIAQLVSQGKVDYGGKVGDYVDGFSTEVSTTVAIHHLLTHTSGLGNYMRIDHFWEDAETWDSVEEAWEGTLRYARMDTVGFPPGSGNEYSNTGFVILGAIVQEVSGLDYYDYIRRHVFKASGTTVADFYTAPRWRADRRIAHPYVKGDDGENIDKIDERQTFVGTPAGGSFASAADLDRIVRTLMSEDLVRAPYLDLALSPKLPRNPTQEDHPRTSAGRPPSSFGNYLTISTLHNDQWVLGHGGGAPGISANVHWFPDSDYTLAVLANYDNAAGPVVNKAQQLIVNQRGR